MKSVRGLQLLPIYIRSYPEKEIAGHIIGYVGSKGKLPTGPINHMDPLWEQVEGRAGLEKEFNKNLTGTPGVWRLMFDEDGNKILDELQIRPKPGGAVVTTLNLKWQKDAERILSRGKRRGAMVVLDCVTGEVLVMASTPSYDPNMFIPNISQKDYDALRNDPAGPLGARAFQGRYPPASTFKVLTVASALRNNKITENTLVYCPASVTIGNHVFKNWSKTPLGDINCVRALAMSNNPFMYQMGLKLGAEALMDTARAFGLGERTGLPIPDDPGLVPTSDYMIRNYKRDFMSGDAANLSIGQGTLLVTPLQVAHMMSGVANGYLPRLQLIKQIQDGNANVVYAPKPQEVQRPLPAYERALSSVRKGMREVVEAGTGGRARLSYASIAGKSGTAQWGPEREDKRLAWFAGFMPCDNPRFAYVVLYEGRAHERLGGGAAAAPIVKEFFETEKKTSRLLLTRPKMTSRWRNRWRRPRKRPRPLFGNGAGRLPSCRTTCRPACMIRKGWSRSRLMKSLPIWMTLPMLKSRQLRWAAPQGLPGRRRLRCRRSLLRPPSRRAGVIPITSPDCPSRFPAILTVPPP